MLPALAAVQMAPTPPASSVHESSLSGRDSSPPEVETTRCALAAGRRDRDCLGWAVPDYAFVQTGGFVGLLTIGLGYALFDDWVNVGAAYGISPAFHSGRTVHTVHLGIGVRPLELRLSGALKLVPYAGGGFLVAFGEDYFVDPPARYEPYSDLYYLPTALHLTIHAGVEVDFRAPSPSFERQGLFWEVRTLDRFLVDWLSNTAVVEPWEAWSSALGYRLAF